MKAIKFSNALKEAGRLSYMTSGHHEPDVVVRKGPDGHEVPLRKVKFRRGKIILEY